jgi:hypothetical protein
MWRARRCEFYFVQKTDQHSVPPLALDPSKHNIVVPGAMKCHYIVAAVEDEVKVQKERSESAEVVCESSIHPKT